MEKGEKEKLLFQFKEQTQRESKLIQIVEKLEGELKNSKKAIVKKKDKNLDQNQKAEKKVEKKQLSKPLPDEKVLEKEKNLRRLERMILAFYMEKFSIKTVTPKETDPFVQLKQIFQNYENYMDFYEQNNLHNPFKGSVLKKDSVSQKMQSRVPEPKKSTTRSVTKNFIAKTKSSTKLTFSANRNLGSTQSTAELNSMSTKKNFLKSSVSPFNKGENYAYN